MKAVTIKTDYCAVCQVHSEENVLLTVEEIVKDILRDYQLKELGIILEDSSSLFK